jgi:hypothetical protein
VTYRLITLITGRSSAADACPGDGLKGLISLDLVHLDLLLASGAYPALVADEAHRPKEVPFDHEAVEASDALLRVDPVQHQIVLDWGSQVVRHFSRALPQPPLEGFIASR